MPAAPGVGASRAAGGVKATDLGDFDQPVYTATAPGRANRHLLFVVEQEGTVRVVRRGRVRSAPFLDISDRVDAGGERGLLSIAFDPGYAKNRRLYAYYTDLEGDIVVSQLRRSAAGKLRVKPNLLREVIEVPHPTFPNHNGGQVSFGPDGSMYLATGDGGLACDPDENAQDPESLLGKLLRIDPLAGGGYSTPAGNPFVGGPGADEIYALGLRNPFRFSFDERTKTIAIADVGQVAWEEIDYLKLAAARGANFGWDAYEGRDPFSRPAACSGFDPDVTPLPPQVVAPIHQYGHSGPGFTGCAVIGGPVVRDERLRGLLGRYLFSDSCNGALQGLTPAIGGTVAASAVGPSFASPSSITEGRNGRVYVTDLAAGKLFRLDP